MSLDPPTYLKSLQNNIRARSIPWDGAARAGTITDSDLKQIRAIDKVRKEVRKQTVDESLEGIRSLLLGGQNGRGVFESAAKRTDIIQYMLVLTGDLTEDIPSVKPALLEHPDPFKPLLPFLNNISTPQDPTPLLTSSVLSELISEALLNPSKCLSKAYEALPKVYKYLSTLAKSSDNGLQDIAVQEYSTLLRSKKSRELFWNQRKDTIAPLIGILRTAAGGEKDTDSTLWSGNSSVRNTTEVALSGGVGLQLLYHVLLVIWQLSFEGSLVGETLEDDHEIIPLYTHLLRVSPKEKTTRLLLSTLYNLISTNRSFLLPAATLAKLPAILTNLATRHLTDPDLLEDLQALQEMLDDYTKTKTTFDEYAAEVLSGHLRWSPPHRSSIFWRENARKILDDQNSQLPRKLAEIMGKSWDNDKQVLAIACNDVGSLVREVPEKRTQLERLGLKTRVMELMVEGDETVRWESLKALGDWLRYSFES
ncbi:MAG: H(+)-transporting V1 sector ATPase subunit H [Cirrosporium novae-zelandiae]|nr:MAG: H(+)-transporting V1 sector ATPase subunit H [Cirrosporium novae-zelandiae]